MHSELKFILKAVSLQVNILSLHYIGYRFSIT